ncbi:MAG: Plasmid stabilization system [Candidatus Woesebacteria bacterium GW2011_GWA2_44_33]|uniref:Plasmid stabilization system n=2 Tax=Candidatus Woeseibacteriota TaxID=1752722 RepID=A0A0G1NAM4_9BACT|nr:MAG: Plasmid stabilization system [Candidatus Woesebacteria bacterium GW2011_GWA2_44_33]KKU17566.1 MAG: Plasmid stabilization system [Candidatus Woesebacteria bacterium GW2011_GWC2_45_9]
MNVVVSPHAKKQLKKLPKIIQLTIVKRLKALRNPSSVEAKKLQGYKDIFRTRVGSCRIIYRKKPDVVYVILIAQRKEAYLLTRKILG